MKKDPRWPRCPSYRFSSLAPLSTSISFGLVETSRTGVQKPLVPFVLGLLVLAIDGSCTSTPTCILEYSAARKRHRCLLYVAQSVQLDRSVNLAAEIYV